jgi:hypothetical protein
MKYLIGTVSCTSKILYNLWSEDNLINSIFKLKKRIVQISSGVSKSVSSEEIFHDDNIPTVASLYILEVVCYIKRVKRFTGL